ncbi:MAG: DNA polymerase III subunit delta, partial [Lachnospiraceae bacterium]
MKRIQADIKSGQFHRVYLLYGPEAYLRLSYANKLCEAILPSSDTLNYARFDGAKTEESAIIDFAETMPFLAERRLIRVQDSGFFKKAADHLPDYLKKIPDYAVIVFVENEIDKRSRLFKAVSSTGLAVEFPIQDERTLLRWGAGILARAKLRIREDDMRYLLQRTGSDMGRLSSEINKLIHYLRGREQEEIWREEALAEAYALEEARMEAELYGFGAESPDASLASLAARMHRESDSGIRSAASSASMPDTELAVTRADINAVTSILLEDHIFDMLRAVTGRETDRALSLYAELLALKEPPIRILVMLEREFNRLLFVKDLSDHRASASEIEKETGIRGFAIRRYL